MTLMHILSLHYLGGRVSSTWVDMEKETKEEVVLNITQVIKAVIGSEAIPVSLSSGLIQFDHKCNKIARVNTYLPSIAFCYIKEIQQLENFQTMFLDITINALV